MEDPFYEHYTIFWQIKKRIIAIWPTLYKGFNHILFSIVDALKEMLVSAKDSFKL